MSEFPSKDYAESVDLEFLMSEMREIFRGYLRDAFNAGRLHTLTVISGDRADHGKSFCCEAGTEIKDGHLHCTQCGAEGV